MTGKRVNQQGVPLIDSREHRTQAMNREAARARLIALIQAAAVRPKKRRKTKPTKASKERRIESKKKRATMKAGCGRVAND